MEKTINQKAKNQHLIGIVGARNLENVLKFSKNERTLY